MPQMNFKPLISLADNDALGSLKDIGSKIIPNDIWSVVIQLLATAILVLILAKFLVKPAKKFIKERQEYIQSNIDEAINKNKEADDRLSMAEKQLQDSRVAGKEIIENAKVTALSEKKKIVDETKKEVITLKDKAYQELESERLKMKKELSEEVVDVALLAASKIVEREINEEDNRKIVSDFVKKDQSNG